ncbi:MAG: DUF4388 domain-containing protein [Anaeromyxobacter sp.]
MRIRVGIGADGEVVLPADQAEALGLIGGGEGELVSAHGAFALLAPARGDAPSAWFAGSLAALSVAEVVQFVFTSLRTGVLLLAFGEGAAPGRTAPHRLRRKSIHFRDGQVVFASSTNPADRLGAVLARAGRVSAADLERCAHLVRSNHPLGQVLVDEGILTSAQLFDGIALQVKEILLSAFTEPGGTFAFLEGPADEQNAVRLQQRTRDLLLEGIRRVEEVDGLAQGLGGRAVVLARGGDGAGRPADQVALLAALDGARTLEDAALEAELPLRDALTAARGLVDAGLAAPVQAAAAEAPGPASPPVAAAAGPFDAYRRILRRVHAALSAGHPDAGARLNSYFDRLPARVRPIFEGVTIGEGGELDAARVLANVNATGQFRGAAARARALEALEDLLAFALFEVKNCLPRAEADALLREVGRMQMGKP